MKGLLIKDMRLMMQQKKFFIMLLLLAIALNFNSDDCYFVIGYLTFVSAFFVISTISYDEADNGFTFLMSLPPERKEYVREKYLFGIMLCVAGWIVGVIISLIYHASQFKSQELVEFLWNAFILIPILLLMLSIMLPIQMKYGVEKSRIMMFVIFGAVGAGAFFIDRISKGAGIDFLKILDGFSKYRISAVALSLFAAAVVLALISCKISAVIMERKDF